MKLSAYVPSFPHNPCCGPGLFPNFIPFQLYTIPSSLSDPRLLQQASIIHVQPDAVSKLFSSLTTTPQSYQSKTLLNSQSCPLNSQNNRHPRSHPLAPRTRPKPSPNCHPSHRDFSHDRARAPARSERIDRVPRESPCQDGIVYEKFRVSGYLLTTLIQYQM